MTCSLNVGRQMAKQQRWMAAVAAAQAPSSSANPQMAPPPSAATTPPHPSPQRSNSSAVKWTPLRNQRRIIRDGSLAGLSRVIWVG